MTQSCPVCGVFLPSNARYPDYICQSCASHLTDANGRKVEFFNIDMSGGCQGVFADTGEPYLSSLCFAGAMQCWADEARFGGIVVRPAPRGWRPADGEMNTRG